MDKKLIGKITHFFPKITVAVMEVSATVKVGDKISIEKGDSVVEQVIDSMQIEHKNVQEAKKGSSIGLKTVQPVAVGSLVYKVE